MVSQLVVDGAELVEGLRVVILQLGRRLEVADGFSHLAHPDQTVGPHLARLHVPGAALTPAHNNRSWGQRPDAAASTLRRRFTAFYLDDGVQQEGGAVAVVALVALVRLGHQPLDLVGFGQPTLRLRLLLLAGVGLELEGHSGRALGRCAPSSPWHRGASVITFLTGMGRRSRGAMTIP